MEENKSVGEAATRITERKLRRIAEHRHRWAGGVCAGVAYWLGIPVLPIRVFWATIALFGLFSKYYDFSASLYIFLWIFLPKWEETPADYGSATED